MANKKNWFLTSAPDFTPKVVEKAVRFEFDNNGFVGGHTHTHIDFAAHEAPAQKLARPINANTQAGKLLAWLVEGHTLTPITAMRICGGTEATRRLRELRRTLQAHGIYLDSKRIKAGNTTVKEWRLMEWERDEARKLLKGEGC